MPLSPQRRTELLRLLQLEFAGLLRNAVQIALQTSTAFALVKELEADGYQVLTDLDYVIRARPVELAFDLSLTPRDRIFLARIRIAAPASE